MKTLDKRRSKSDTCDELIFKYFEKIQKIILRHYASPYARFETDSAIREIEKTLVHLKRLSDCRTQLDFEFFEECEKNFERARLGEEK